MSETAVNTATWIRYYQNGMLSNELTFAEVQHEIEYQQKVLAEKGLVRGERILVCLRNSPQAVITYLALRNSGIIAVPVNPNESKEWLTFTRGHSGARAMITQEGISLFDVTNRIPMVDRITTIVYTSGTTGTPKGVCLGWEQWHANALALNAHHNVTRATVHGSPLPLYHCNAHGFSMFSTYIAQCKWILFDKATAGFLDVVNEEQISIVSLVPTLLARLLQDRPNWKPHSGLRYIVTAAAPLTKSLLEDILNLWGVRVIQGYGLSESTNFSCTMPVDLSDDTYREIMFPYPSIGVALPGVKISIGEHDQENHVGEFRISSPCNSVGYWKEQERSSDWLSTGDLGYYRIIDGRRFYYISGRLKEQINRGGESLSPLGIEEELRKLGATGEFAVVPIRHQDLGEEVGLVSVEPVDESILKRIPWHRRPKQVFLIDQIPRTVTGKVKRNEAAKLFV